MSSHSIRYRLPGIILTIIGALLLLHTFDPQYADTLVGLQFGPVFFPQLVLAGWLVLSVLSIFVITVPSRMAMDQPRHHGRALMMATALFIYILALKPLGFVPASFLLCLVAQWVAANRIWAWPVLWAALLSLLGWAAFELVIGVPLPQSTLF